MNSHWWFIFQLKTLTPDEAEVLLASMGIEPDESAPDCYIANYQDNGYKSFKELSAAEKLEEIELFLGNEILTHIKDPRGLLVHPDKGQSFDGRIYQKLCAEGFFVKLVPEAETVEAPVEENEDDSIDENTGIAISGIMRWIGKNEKKKPELAQRLMDLVVAAQWEELANTIRPIPDLRRFAKLIHS